jgi:hypothetical protein
MPKKVDLRMSPRIAHYFRDVDLRSKSRPEFVPESFPLHCRPDDDRWSAGYLLRIAVRFQHLWATYGVRNGERTITGPHPAVCFSDLSLSDLIAVRDGFLPRDESATQYAITFPLTIAENGGIQPVTQPSQEWRWQYTGNYDRCIDRIEMDGVEGSVIPGLKLSQKKWSGLGIVVPNMVTARVLQYDLLLLIDQGVVSQTHFDHMLVCDELPASIDGLGEEEMRAAYSKACFDFRECIRVSASEADVSRLDFSSRVLILESTTPKRPVVERGGCWLWFQDNTHPYVRALIVAGLVELNERGRYLASLDELDPHRDLRERQEITRKLSQELQEKYGIRSSYFIVLNSYDPDDHPCYSRMNWGGGYFITDSPEDEED